VKRSMIVGALLCALSMTAISGAVAAENSVWVRQDPHDYRCIARDPSIVLPPPITLPGGKAIPAPPKLCDDDQVAVSTATADAPKAPPAGTKLSAEAVATYTKRYGAKRANALKTAAARAARAETGHAAASSAHAARRPIKRTAAAHSSMNWLGSAWYSHAEGGTVLPWTSGTIGLGGGQTIEHPYLEGWPGAHTLSQLWAMDGTVGGFYSDVETGWNIDSGLYGSTANPLAPHLFVFSWDGGIPGCYNLGPACAASTARGHFSSAGSSVYAGMELGCCGTVVPWLIQRYGDQWWVNVGNQWVGYYAKAAYPSYFNYGLTTLQGGGEVSSPTSAACSDMGNGNAASSAGAAHWEGFYRVTGDGIGPASDWPLDLSPDQYASDPSQYSVQVGPTGTFLRYGGLGFC
jgi:hypothetical protein